MAREPPQPGSLADGNKQRAVSARRPTVEVYAAVDESFHPNRSALRGEIPTCTGYSPPRAQAVQRDHSVTRGNHRGTALAGDGSDRIEPVSKSPFCKQYDDFVILYNEKFAKPGMAIIQALRTHGLLTPTQFDEEIEWTWFYLWHH